MGFTSDYQFGFNPVQLLELLFWLGIVLAILGLGLFFLTFGIRIFRSLRERRDQRIRSEMTQELLGLVFAPETPIRLWERFPEKHFWILLQAMEGVFQKIEGKDKDCFLERLDEDELLGNLGKSFFRKWAFQRERICQALSWLRGEKSLSILQIGLKDRSYRVRFMAAEGLAQRDELPNPLNFFRLLNPPVSESSLRLAELFCHAGSDWLSSAIQLQRQGDLPPLFELPLIRAIGNRQLLEGYDLLETAIEDLDPLIRQEAWRALTELQLPRTRMLLEKGFQDPDQEVRAFTIQCAGVLQAPESIPHLVSLLQKSDWWIQYRAMEALCQMGENGRAVLSELVIGDDEELSQLAISILMERSAHA